MTNDKFRCPYCFKEPAIRDIEFRCRSIVGDSKCEEVDDIKLREFQYLEDDASKMEKRCFGLDAAEKAVDPFEIPSKKSCPDCGVESNRIVCPECHNTLPKSTFSGNNIVISIVGSTNSGKSAYIGVLINLLKKEVI